MGAASAANRRPETAFAPDGAPTEVQPPAEVQASSCRIGNGQVYALGGIQGNDRTFFAPVRRSWRSFALDGWRRRNAGDRAPGFDSSRRPTRARLRQRRLLRCGMRAATRSLDSNTERHELEICRVPPRVPRRRLSLYFIVAGVALIHRYHPLTHGEVMR